MDLDIERCSQCKIKKIAACTANARERIICMKERLTTHSNVFIIGDLAQFFSPRLLLLLNILRYSLIKKSQIV